MTWAQSGTVWAHLGLWHQDNCPCYPGGYAPLDVMKTREISFDRRCIKRGQVNHKGLTLVIGCLLYKWWMRQITGNLTGVRHGAFTLERLNAAVETVRRSDGGKGGDVDSHLDRRTYEEQCNQQKAVRSMMPIHSITSVNNNFYSLISFQMSYSNTLMSLCFKYIQRPLLHS